MRLMSKSTKPMDRWSIDFKGIIVEKYYFHTIKDYSARWPEVKLVESISFPNLRPALEKSVGVTNSVQDNTQWRIAS